MSVWAAERVVETREGEPGQSAWLLARRSVSDPTEFAYYFSNAAEETPLTRLAEAASSRYRVEQGFEQAKGRRG
ncbi:MAG: hypothetical protein O3A46_17475 [Candidatus Poribacteria bacterium]|nr:hypothetical protein [Candidatus Poribacteria bacterium]